MLSWLQSTLGTDKGVTDEAKKHGAIPLTPEEVLKTTLEQTDGRGVDAALEVVGNAHALDTAIQAVRPFGAVASCGVHAGPKHDGDPELTRQAFYNKNLRLQLGRCPVRAVFNDALECLKQHDELFKSFVQHTVPLSEGPQYCQSLLCLRPRNHSSPWPSSLVPDKDFEAARMCVHPQPFALCLLTNLGLVWRLQHEDGEPKHTRWSQGGAD